MTFSEHATLAVIEAFQSLGIDTRFDHVVASGKLVGDHADYTDHAECTYTLTLDTDLLTDGCQEDFVEAICSHPNFPSNAVEYPLEADCIVYVRSAHELYGGEFETRFRIKPIDQDVVVIELPQGYRVCLSLASRHPVAIETTRKDAMGARVYVPLELKTHEQVLDRLTSLVWPGDESNATIYQAPDYRIVIQCRKRYTYSSPGKASHLRFVGERVVTNATGERVWVGDELDAEEALRAFALYTVYDTTIRPMSLDGMTLDPVRSNADPHQLVSLCERYDIPLGTPGYKVFLMLWRLAMKLDQQAQMS